MSDQPSRVYWKSFEERDEDPVFLERAQAEFAKPPLLPENLSLSRRGFLKGFAVVFAGAALTACTRGPLKRAIPLLVQPEELVPGRSLWYATHYRGVGVLAKVRDGRPIKLEGNAQHPFGGGGLSAVDQAQLLGLYEPSRLRAPRIGGDEAEWADVDAQMIKALEPLRTEGKLRLLTGTITSPTERAAIKSFLARFADARHIEWDSLGHSAILDAHKLTHGARVLPRYRFEKAEAIVSFGADFLGTWISPVDFTAGYSKGRRLQGDPPRLSWHCQLEARMSLTGTNADQRVRLLPGDMGLVLAHIATRLAHKAGEDVALGELAKAPLPEATLDEIADRMWAARGKALCVCGVNDTAVQTLVNLVNHLTGAYGHTVDLDRPSYQHGSDDAGLAALVAEMVAGEVGALLVRGVNPSYALPGHLGFGAALAQVPVAVSFSAHLDETSSGCRFVCPEHHFLEAWGDAEPVAGVLSVAQPTIAPLGKTRSMRQSLDTWAGKTREDRDALAAHWRAQVFPAARAAGLASGTSTFEAFLDQAIHDGYFEMPVAAAEPRGFLKGGLLKRAAALAPRAKDTFELVLYPKVGLGDGSDALNPWLQELPDPVTKAVWDNYACLSPKAAKRLGVELGDVVRVSGKTPDGVAASIELPALVQAGQHDDAVAVALGYGRKGTERFTTIGPRWLEAKPTTPEGEPVGVDASSLRWLHEGNVADTGLSVSVERTGRRSELALTQDHHSLFVPEHLAPKGGEKRPHVQETTLSAYSKDPGSGGHAGHEPITLWNDDFKTDGPKWGMAVDLNVCTGCSGCSVACQAENNIPVVGKDEVRRHREMTWIRIDRYYADIGDEGDVDVVHQPMMCQHCANAPCETVCPVLATVHSEDGLNQQIYNRCVGTRYCANNCPYKVRRFNWFDYPHGGEVQRLVLNPDVTIRSRGVMEKCSMCIQRIQEGKIQAKVEGRPLKDGDIQPACVQSCPADALVFGDFNDPESRLSKAVRSPRAYTVLQELNVRSSVHYMTKVRHRDGKGTHHG